MILMSKVCYEYGGVTFIEHRFFWVTIADAPNGCKLYCTLRDNDLCCKFLMIIDLNILRDFSVSAGLITRRDAWGVEKFFSSQLSVYSFCSQKSQAWLQKEWIERCDELSSPQMIEVSVPLDIEDFEE